ncbi:NADH dehydrogenase (ubiquinone) 78K chain precursor, 5-prime end [Brettanomyces nanus]|uniref:NADH-ubiquinone oxidoreductase 78 kDa subunit, mitochondrial n=1 Tax=Eeniella nana TaxID=13502 RepID=A0A875SAC1_EENNA|nr:NADH dehydrogenase (ubiquinone) 78K chain precursor, 5-prime end [Brettanomyces nanus]QPG77025.1 NADH dehydrogenase (ubiquinone) 78K chain precursor, 5-prime end [Brettanomyces nanus]
MLSRRTISGMSLRRLFHSASYALKEVTLRIDDTPVTIEAGSSIIQAAEKAGVKIPRYCYHDKLSIAGNCRMCLVEIERSPKMAAACSMPVAPGMHVLTNTDKVKDTREGVTEFLLSNHPLDCPICDQGGECDLQEQTLRHGSDRGRFHEVTGKRAVENKAIGPLVKTSMNRCIHCTRCVRFLNDIAGAPEFGTTGRGNDLQIGTYIERNVNSELSGNIVDLCPVGALTSKPYAFKARPWELKRTETIDVLDALGSAIRVDARGAEVMRILPILNEEINEEWLSDRSRYSYDALKIQRLTKPLVLQDGGFVDATWDQALGYIAAQIAKIAPAKNEVKAVVGPLTDVESMVAMKDLVNRLDSDNLGFDVDVKSVPSADIRSNYLFNSKIEGIDECDQMLIVGSNPRFEASVLNARIRGRWLSSDLKVYHVGEKFDTTFDMTELGDTAAHLKKALSGSVGKKLASASKPMIIVGSGVLENTDSAAIEKIVKDFVKSKSNFNTPEWNGLNLLHRQASRAGALDIGFYSPSKAVSKTIPKVVFLLGADEMDASAIPKDAFVIYLGHHGDTGASLANVVLPGSAYTEKSATFVNTEGRSQMTHAATGPPGASREDWKILKALSEYLGVGLPYENIRQLRARIETIAPHLVRYESVEKTSPEIFKLGIDAVVGAPRVTNSPLINPIKNYYFADVISRNSKTMAQCVGSFGTKIDKVNDENAHAYLGVA